MNCFKTIQNWQAGVVIHLGEVMELNTESPQHEMSTEYDERMAGGAARAQYAGMRGMMSSLAILVVFIVVIWAIGRLVGFEISLWGTLIGSIVLTVILNLVMGAFRKGRR